MKTYDEEHDITKAMLKTITEGILTSDEQINHNNQNVNGNPSEGIPANKNDLSSFISSIEEKTNATLGKTTIMMYPESGNVIATCVVTTPINGEFTFDLAASDGLYVTLNKTQLTNNGSVFLQKLIGVYTGWCAEWGKKLKEY